MAAKQGLSAQFSQASEDAKRAVLQRTSLTSSLWFSNLNTTCTIKSAPPRTPDVLGLLASKSGWLLKRNEQHVWQSRYCCVVPHTFLYYFDAHPSAPCQNPPLTAKQQEALNKAVRQGYGKRGAAKPQHPRSSLYHVLGTGGAQTTASPPEIEGGDTTNHAHSSHTLQPAGIIDLECYTTIHRNSQDQLLLELAGDETVNPDLRSFYFHANNEEEGEDWTQALLSQRHSSLMDEKEAYRQVCDGFAQQLQMLHTQLEDAQQVGETQQDELYRVRSQMEDTRRNCWRLVQDTLERSDSSVPAKKAYRTDLETIQAQDLGLLAAVQLLCDYTRVLEETCGDGAEKMNKLETKLEQKQEGDQHKVKELEKELDHLKAEMNQQQSNWQTQIETLQQKYIQSQKECQDVQKDLASQRMEMTMYQSSTRTKINELQSHKKILKKEVIELRQKVEEVDSELDLHKHKENSTMLEVEQERQKAKLLERYVEKVESQVKVQQNMMEMMSAAGSIHGSRDGSYRFDVPNSPPVRSISKSYTSPSSQHIIVNTPSSVPNEEEDTETRDLKVPSPSKRTNSNARSKSQVDDSDNKSHMSELTEDRTQRHFDAALYYQTQPSRPMVASPRSLQQHTNMGGPPSIIGVAEQDEQEGTPKKLDTIMTTHSMSLQSARKKKIPPYEMVSRQFTPRGGGDSVSVSSQGSKLSVAQRSRLEADRQSTPVRIRYGATSSTPLRGNNSATPQKDKHQQMRSDSSERSQGSSFFGNIGKRLEDVIDSTMLGVDGLSESSSDDSYNNYGSTVDDESNGKLAAHHEEKKQTDAHSVTTSVGLTEVDCSVSELKHGDSSISLFPVFQHVSSTVSLAERQQFQRAQQLRFLKDQGLIKHEQDVRGGAGVTSPRDKDSGSVASLSFPGTAVGFPGSGSKQKRTGDI